MAQLSATLVDKVLSIAHVDDLETDELLECVDPLNDPIEPLLDLTLGHPFEGKQESGTEETLSCWTF